MVRWLPGYHTWCPFSTGPTCSPSPNACHLGLWVCREAGVTPKAPPPSRSHLSPPPLLPLLLCISTGGLCLLSSSSPHFLPLSFTFFHGSWCGKWVEMLNSAASGPGNMRPAVYHLLAGSAWLSRCVPSSSLRAGDRRLALWRPPWWSSG